MGNTQASANAAYEAAIVTRDRALKNRADSIDILQRLLASMEDDPLVLKTKENLLKVLENPEIITDEVFNNIMSKSAEVLDANFDAQVQQTLAEARSTGVAGPTLQLKLQKAKNARGAAIAGAYRDAIIDRATLGLKTNMEAITSATSLLENLFNQQRVATEDLVNVTRELVEEPARSFGVDLPSAGVMPPEGSYNWKPIDSGIDQLNQDYPAFNSDVPGDELGLQPTFEELAAQYGAENVIETENGFGVRQTDVGTGYGNQANGQPGTAASVAAAERAAEEARNAAEVAQIKAQYGGGEVTSKPGTGFMTDSSGKKWTVNEKGEIVNPYMAPRTPVKPSDLAYPSEAPVKPAASATALGTATAGVTGAGAAVPPVPTIQSALSGLSGLGDQIVKNFTAPVSGLKDPITIATSPKYTSDPSLYPTTRNPDGSMSYNEATLQTKAGPIVTGGGQDEANRALDLVNQYGSSNVIGTSSGAGIRKSATPAAVRTTGATRAPGTDDLGLDRKQFPTYEAYYNEYYKQKRAQTAAKAAAGGALAGPAGAIGAAVKGATSIPAATWWDTATKAATSGASGIGAALAKLFT